MARVSYEELRNTVIKILNKLGFKKILEQIGKVKDYDYFVDKITAFIYAIAGAETQWGEKGAGREWILGYGVLDSGRLYAYKGYEKQIESILKEKIIPILKTYGDIPETQKEIEWFARTQYKTTNWKDWVKNVYDFFKSKMLELKYRIQGEDIEKLAGIDMAIPPRPFYVYTKEPSQQQDLSISLWEGFKEYSKNVEKAKEKAKEETQKKIEESTKNFFQNLFLSTLKILGINISDTKESIMNIAVNVFLFVLGVILIVNGFKNIFKD